MERKFRKFTSRFMTLLIMAMLQAFGIVSVLAADAQIARKEQGLQSFPVEASTQIYKGALVCLNTSGYLVAAADTDGYRFVGVAYENVLGTTQGALSCRVHTAGVFLLPATAITQAMVGRTLYVVNDGTVDDSSTYRLPVGVLVRYESTTSGWVDIGQRELLTGFQDHLYLNTDLATKSVRINNKTFTNTSGDITGARIAPRQGATSTGSVRGLEVIPGGSAAASSFGFANLQGVISEAYGNTIGNITGIVAAFEGKVDMPSGYPGTVTGPVSILRCFNDMHGTVTNGVFVLDVANHGGNKVWDGLIRGAEALGTHSMTTASDKTGSAKSGTIKVKFNDTLYHIQLYAD